MLDVSPQEIASIVRSVFEATFEIHAESALVDLSSSGSVSSSLVGIAGNWDGAVIVDCSPGVAADLASIMFGLAPAEVQRDHIEDTLGELANMIGGNLKALLVPPCTLSLPTVVEGRDYRVRVPGASIVRDLHFRLPGGRLRVIVAERGVAGETPPKAA